MQRLSPKKTKGSKCPHAHFLMWIAADIQRLRQRVLVGSFNCMPPKYLSLSHTEVLNARVQNSRRCVILKPHERGGAYL